MQLDVGVVDLKIHVHEPSAHVESMASSDDLSSLAGRAAAVSTQRSYDPWTCACISAAGMSRSNGPLASPDVLRATSGFGWIALSQ